MAPARMQRLLSLFRLDFADPQEMRADVAGKPVYLGLMMNADGVVRLKPQNLLVNLPLRQSWLSGCSTYWDQSILAVSRF